MAPITSDCGTQCATRASNRPIHLGLCALQEGGAAGKVSERKLADQSPGQQLADSVTVVSNTVAEGRRTVVVTRALKGKTGEYFTFDQHVSTIPMINAVGSGPKLAFHKTKDPVTLTLLVSHGLQLQSL